MSTVSLTMRTQPLVAVTANPNKWLPTVVNSMSATSGPATVLPSGNVHSYEMPSRTASSASTVSMSQPCVSERTMLACGLGCTSIWWMASATHDSDWLSNPTCTVRSYTPEVLYVQVMLPVCEGYQY